jgi:hypothetical protein
MLGFSLKMSEGLEDWRIQSMSTDMIRCAL